MSFSMVCLLFFMVCFSSATIPHVHANPKPQLPLTAKPVSGVGPSVCEDDTPTQILVGQCANMCAPFSQEAFASCASLISRGCVLKGCGKDGAMDHVECKFDPRQYDNITACAGDTIVFDGIRAPDLSRLTYNVGLRIPTSVLATKDADLYLLIDQSLGHKLDRAKKVAQDVVDRFGEVRGVFLGLGTYNSGENNDPQTLVRLTSDAAAVKNAIQRIAPVGAENGRGLLAFQRTTRRNRSGWREREAVRVLIVISDKPAPEPIQRRVLGRKVCFTREDVIHSLKNNSISFTAVNLGEMDRYPASGELPGESCPYIAGRGQATEIAEATGGEVVQDGDSLVSSIEKRIVKPPTSQELDINTEGCKPILSFDSHPVFPAAVEPGSIIRVSNTIFVNPAICDFGVYECTNFFTLGGESLTKVSLSFRAVTGCHRL